MSDIQLSDRVLSIKESPSAAAADRVRALRAQGRDILGLTVGEPDFATPPEVQDAAVAAIHAGQTKYTSANGTPELRAAIAGYALRRYALEIASDQICVGVGGKQVIFLALMATLRPGDEVIVPAPYWVSYPDMVTLNGGTPVTLTTSEQNGFKATPEQLEQAITPATRWIIFNSPSNPSGAVYTESELVAIADVLRAHPQVLVLTDDIYNEIVYSAGGAAPALARVAPDLLDRLLIVNGVSKTYAMTGWRIGYGIGPTPLISAMNKLVSQISSCTSSVSQAAAAAALSGDQGVVADMVETYRHRRDLVVSGINEIDGLSCTAPNGAFYAYVNCSGLIGRTTPQGHSLDSDEQVSEYLLHEAEVAVVPGAAYGLSPYFRISFATDTTTLRRALEQMAAAIARLG